ncbi:COMM domain-containing protein 3-like [Chrysoperla carnea]|uniref:COMM domain-containing protein 3-like n=1 Tax=Chrysoperla carnea TaxID=189513 RepID=UPI001D07902D|nr:COMM domain-containing protein 3-like [Chrysoperla carnea]
MVSSGVAQNLVKELYAALSDLIIQNARYDLTEENLQEFCSETLKLNTSYGQIITKFCYESKSAVQKKLSTITILSEPMLKGLNWKLDCIVKTSEAASVDTDAIYRIRLVALKYNPETNENEPTYISFSCDVLELTDLVSKLKDICHHVEKLTENTQ